jgi:hypothetical protein
MQTPASIDIGARDSTLKETLMRTIRFMTAALAAFALATGACAVEDEGDEAEIAEQGTDLADEAAGADDGVVAKAAPSLSLSAISRCISNVLNVSGQVTTSASSFTLKFNNLPISAPGGHFSFNPGGSGTLVAKACNGSACTTRSRPIQWRSCWGEGGVEP